MSSSAGPDVASTSAASPRERTVETTSPVSSARRTIAPEMPWPLAAPASGRPRTTRSRSPATAG